MSELLLIRRQAQEEKLQGVADLLEEETFKRTYSSQERWQLMEAQRLLSNLLDRYEVTTGLMENPLR